MGSSVIHEHSGTDDDMGELLSELHLHPGVEVNMGNEAQAVAQVSSIHSTPISKVNDIVHTNSGNKE